jgi:hypothetical protein
LRENVSIKGSMITVREPLPKAQNGIDRVVASATAILRLVGAIKEPGKRVIIQRLVMNATGGRPETWYFSDPFVWRNLAPQETAAASTIP